MAYPQDRNYVAIKNDIYTRFSIILENSQEIVLNEIRVEAKTPEGNITEWQWLRVQCVIPEHITFIIKYNNHFYHKSSLFKIKEK